MKIKRGFTLVELLVVISIIALLLAILIPTMRRAKEQANSIVCKSNLRNYGLAGAMYLQSNNNAYPHPICCIDTRDSFNSSHPKECHWHDSGVQPQGPFWPYLRAKGVLICPTFSAITRTRRSLHQDYIRTLPGSAAIITICNTLSIEPRLSYSMNGFLSAGDEVENLVVKNGTLQMPKVTNVKCPSATLFFTEENIWTITRANDGIQVSQHAWNDMYFGTAMYGTGSDSIATFHKASDTKLDSGVSNVLFVDGHVDERKAYDQEDLRNRSSSKSYYLATGRTN